MNLIEFRTLGTLDLRGADGREMHSLLAQPKRVALLAYLCIAQPRGFHRRDTLLGLFWPNSDQGHARMSLRRALHILRQALGDDSIMSRGDEEVAVDFQHVSCDAAVFEEGLKAGRLEEALELYGGDLLPGFFVDDAPEFDHWLDSERTRLRACAARAAYAMAERLETNGNAGIAVNWARRALALAGTDERALRKLIELQCRAGDRAGAIKAYEAFARHLALEYQTQASLTTRSLIEQIRAGNELVSGETDLRAADGREQKGERNAHDRAETLSRPAPKVYTAAETVEATSTNSRENTKRYSAIGVAILMAGSAIWGWTRPATSKHVVRYNLVLDSTEAMARGASWSGRLALSPDGSRLAYISGPRAQLLIRPRNQLHATVVAGTEEASTPFFSPDGQQVGFFTGKNLQMVSLNGGLPITVTDSLASVAGASWGPDGFIYADGWGNVGLVRVEAKPRAVPKWFTELDTARDEIDHTWPDVLPNGKGVLFTVKFRRKNAPTIRATSAIAAADTRTGKHRVLVNDAMYPRYAASGHLLYVTTNMTLMAVPFDQNAMTITGEPIALIEGMRVGGAGSADLAISETGVLVYVTGTAEPKQELVWVTRQGNAQPVDSGWQGYFGSPALSPDGKQLAIAIAPLGGIPDVWVKQLDRGPSFLLMQEGSGSNSPSWTRDGRFVTFSSNATGSWDLWTKRANGSAQGLLQLHEKRGLSSPVWSPDGKWLIFRTDWQASGAGDILGIRPGTDSAPAPLVSTQFTEVSPALSPDGRWLAYTAKESSDYGIYVVPFPNTGAAKWAVSPRGGTEPVWSHSGRELFYRDGAGNLVAVEVKTSPTFSPGRSTVLFPARSFASYERAAQYDVSPDDRRFLMIRPFVTPPDKLMVVENWFEDLKATSRK